MGSRTSSRRGSHLYVAIMAGGAGTRFWPLSRARRPKQVLAIGASRPLITLAVERARLLAKDGRIFAITRGEQAAAVAWASGLPVSSVVVEPEPRDTAPCVGLAAVLAEWRDPDAILAVIPSDHLIEPAAGFRRSLLAAAAAAGMRGLALIGVRPTHPATGFGYIQAGPGRSVREGAPRVFTVAAFKEKPEADVAARYLAEGGYFWNAGMFIARAETILEAMRRHAPAIADGLLVIREAYKESEAKGRRVLRRVYPTLPTISFDRAVLEKASGVSVVEAVFDWDDVGTFSAAAKHGTCDAAGNVVAGDFVGVCSEGLYVHNESPGIVAALGLKDLIIVRTRDAVLVAAKDRSEDVKRIVEKLAAGGKSSYLR